MPRGSKRLIQSTTAPELPLRSTRVMLTLWNLSKNPEFGDDLEKLHGDGSPTMGQAMIDWFPASLTRQMADGYHGKRTHGRRPMDPHCFVPRIHSRRGEGDTSFWQPRRIVDHENPAGKRRHRSTMVVSACKELVYAWDQDMEWVGRIAGFDAAAEDPEVQLDFAGFLPELTGKNKPNKFRGVRALNVAKRGGQFTDGLLIAQLWAILHISAKAGSTVTRVCGIATPGVAALRGDVEYAIGGKLAHFVYVDKDFDLPVQKRRLKGFIYIGAPGPFGPFPEMDEDESSNQKVLPRSLHQGLRVVVFEPFAWEPTPTPGSVPNDWPGRPVPTGVPNGSDNGFTSTTDYPAVGEDVGSQTVVPIPESMDPADDLNIAINFEVPARDVGPPPVNGFAGDIDLRIEWIVAAIGGDLEPGAITGSGETTINSATFPNITATAADARVVFRIPRSDLKDAFGGKVTIAIFRSGTDDQLDNLRVLGLWSGIGPPTSAIGAIPPK